MATVGQLLEQYPQGFVVTPSGHIEKVIFASSHFAAVAMNYAAPPRDGGYLVVDQTGERVVGDALIHTIVPQKLPALEEFFREVGLNVTAFGGDNLEFGRVVRQLYLQYERKIS